MLVLAIDGDGVADAITIYEYDDDGRLIREEHDTDGDGTPDLQDQCPEEMGLPEHGGCPLLDTDCDGIVDLLDACPEIPDTLGFTGCPDLDEDGVLDSLDLCPDIPGATTTGGCPEIAVEDQELMVEAQRQVRFRTASSELLEASREVLNKIVELLKEYPYYRLTLEGYTDSVGRADSNQRLSERRAKACYDYLLEQEVDASRISYEGFGEANPIGNNKTSVGREMNRRVEFHLIVMQSSQEEDGN